MKLQDTILLSLRMLRVNKRRSFLTSLGIIIGIAAVIIIMSVGAGAQSLIINQLNSVGTNLVGILPGASEEDGPPASAFGIIVTTLTYDDALAIGEQVPYVSAVSSYNTGSGSMSYQSQDTSATFYGVMSSYPNVEDIELKAGRFFTEEEERSNARVVVIGSQVWQDLFDGADPIGAKIKIKKEFFEVIGVVSERGTVAFQNQDNVAFMPASTAQNIMLGVKYVNFIRVKVSSADRVPQVVSDVKFLLRDRHNIDTTGIDDFSVRNTQDAINTLTAITDALKFFLAAIAGISLIVGGVGVMNIMLAAVTERVREIGLRKAVGATRGDIIKQFLMETISITFAGGIVGVLIGSFVSFIVATVAGYLGYRWDLVVSPSSIIVGCIVAIIIGLIFGVYPARRAAALDPMSALRYE
jgi:putative ABC transport system permease protein